jgi:hypothetical protein
MEYVRATQRSSLECGAQNGMVRLDLSGAPNVTLDEQLIPTMRAAMAAVGDCATIHGGIQAARERMATAMEMTAKVAA